MEYVGLDSIRLEYAAICGNRQGYARLARFARFGEAEKGSHKKKSVLLLDIVQKWP